MKTLIYVPVIHSNADLGSLAKDVTQRGLKLGTDVWRQYIKTVEGFWDSIARYFDFVNVAGVRIYQDAMIADGEIAKQIIDNGVKAGSQNYELVARLINRGAILEKTEDFKLVKKERDSLLAITQARSTFCKLSALVKYKLIKGRLLNKRDRFIAKRIDETLREGERGIIFIGAFHNLNETLSKNYRIIEIKNTKKVREYQKLLPFHNVRKERFGALGKYLMSEIGR
jgi:hypothetical protein